MTDNIVAKTPCKGGIYGIYCSANGKWYVGQTRNSIKGRIRAHVHLLKKRTHFNPHLQSAFNLYGFESFEYNQLERVFFIQDLTEREAFWIQKLNSVKAGFNVFVETRQLRIYDGSKSSVLRTNTTKKTASASW